VIANSSTSRTPATPPSPTVIVVDDDEALREALSSLFRSVGLRVELYGSAAELLKAKPPAAPRCLVLDIPCRASAASTSSRRSPARR